jgi:hypothetical protein
VTTVAHRPGTTLTGSARPAAQGREWFGEICAACDVDLCWLCLGGCACDHSRVSWADDWTG